jgi:hypothetical protein
MWIRSQNRKILTEIHDVEIDSVNQIWGSGSFVGEYSTEEKALKVLDEIQAIVESKQFCVVDNVDFGNYVLHNGVQVYQMPQDWEVEI